MINFKKVRISGFKSFVDKTELDINVGLTGIVGPNGCGKSNIVEAIRWAMGEGSAKKIRSEGMDDVIFNGTAKRSKRNIAEVTIVLDNSSGSAPYPYTNMDEIEISRKIERDKGSSYRINGTRCRARDVQLFFSDTMIGAKSPALVSQGKVTEIINAKPLQRRQILEESAGVSGLYTRRHEAELKLKSASNNIERLDDILSSLQQQTNSLRRQEKQAKRYKSLSSEIRKHEKLVSYIEWKNLHKNYLNAHNIFRQYEKIVTEKLTTVTQINKNQLEKTKELPETRQHEARSSAAYQAQKIMISKLEDELKRTEELIRVSKEQLIQIENDKSYESETSSENITLLEKLKSEENIILEKQKNEDKEYQIIENKKHSLEEILKLEEKEYRKQLENKANDKAITDTLIKQQKNELFKSEKSKEDILIIEKKLNNKKNSQPESLSIISNEIKELDHSIEKDKIIVVQINKDLGINEDKLDIVSKKLIAHQQSSSKIETEIKTLESLLNEKNDGEFKRIIDEIKVNAGFEIALSRALGDTLSGSLNEKAPTNWKQLNENIILPKLPKNIESIDQHLTYPSNLSNTLKMIGIVNNEDDGNMLQAQLSTGQSLVSKDGYYWRWDGLTIKSSASDANAIELKHRNRIEKLRMDFPEIKGKEKEANEKHNKIKQQISEFKSSINKTNTKIKDNEHLLKILSKKLEKTKDDNIELEKDIDRLEHTRTHTCDEFEKAQINLKSFEDKLNKIKNSNNHMIDQVIDEIKNNLNLKHKQLHEINLQQDKLLQEQNRRKARAHAIIDERLNLKNRSIRAKDQLKKLNGRENEINNQINNNENKPTKINQQINAILSNLSELESKRNIATDRLAKIEAEITTINKSLKEAESALSYAREDRAGSQATAEASKEQFELRTKSIIDHFQVQPNQLIINTEYLKEDGSGELLEDISIDTVRNKKDSLIKSRDNIGPVNLRAEAELEEVENELITLLNEKNDLTQAIEELNSAINKLNKEAKERMQKAFNLVNAHFKILFSKLFNGGNAHLKMIESDDPLNTGLEIFAQPPGKTLQSLSLMSGGEQTLSSIALIFAMFLTNPSPICILDEVDAPLDDSNVDRICDLIEAISKECNTRFLVITHHRLTMARVDRLYGVTMSERGVSQLVSVDFNSQLDLLEEAA